MNTNTNKANEPNDLASIMNNFNTSRNRLVPNLEEIPPAQSTSMQKKRLRSESVSKDNDVRTTTGPEGKSTSTSFSYAEVVRSHPTSSKPSGFTKSWYSMEDVKNKAWSRFPKMADIFRIAVGKAAKIAKSIGKQEEIILKMKKALETNIFPSDWKVCVDFQVKKDVPQEKVNEDFLKIKNGFFCNMANFKIALAEKSILTLKLHRDNPDVLFEFPGFFELSSDSLKAV